MKVFLGGTCNGSTWREELIHMLKIDYFNPVVANWDKAAQGEEIRQRDICDYCLYVFTPRMSGVYAVAEVIDDRNKRPERTIFVRLREDGDAEFSSSQWKSLKMVERMVIRNGGKMFLSLANVANWLNEQT